MSHQARDVDPTTQHRRGFSVSSILSYISGSAESPKSPIKQVRSGTENNEHAPPRQVLPKVGYPDASAFTLESVLGNVDARPLQDSMGAVFNDVQTSVAQEVLRLTCKQNELITDMNKLDKFTKETLNKVNANVRKCDKDLAMLVGTEKLSLLAEQTYGNINDVVRLFQEIDDLLPADERIRPHKSHYNGLATLIDDHQETNDDSFRQRRVVSTPAISSLRSIQESSPAKMTSDAWRPGQSLGETQTVGNAHARPSSPIVEAMPPMRLRLAPRKSKSNLRVPQLRTVPPLPTTQHSSVLPNVERDNISTRTSIASHRSIFSTISNFFGGHPARTIHNEQVDAYPPKSAEETLRKISEGGGSSTLAGRRKPSGLRSSSGLH